MDSNCVFCKVINKEISSNILYEDEDFQVILDSGPATKGHAILLTKKHFVNLFEMDSETAGKLFPVVLKVATVLKETLNCSGFNLVQNNGEDAGQTVFHFHLHLIPRYSDDGVGFTWDSKELDKQEAAKLADNIFTRIN